MLLSPADFDAYSRATGRPVPEEPEERARLVPEITEFRRNQLKSPETQRSEGSGLLQALGIGAAVLGGGALLARGLGRRGGVRMGNAQQAAKEAVQEVTVQDLGNVYRAAGRPAPSRPAPTPTRPTSAPAPTQRTATTPDPWSVAPTPTPRPAGSRQGGVQVTNLYDLANLKTEDLRRAPETLSEAAQTLSSKDFISDYFKRTATPAGTLTESIAAVEKVIPESLVTKQKTIAGRVVDQTANAVDAAEDQMTGRVKAQLQRNEDLDISQIDLLEEMAERDRQWMMEQDEPINQVAAQLPDGLPADQAEGLAKSSAQRFLQRERDEIASLLGEQNIPATNTRIEQELSRRLGKEASEYGPKYTRRKQALQLGATYGGDFFNNLNTQSVNVAGVDFPVSSSDFKQLVLTEDTARRAEDYVTNRRNKQKDFLGNIRLEVEPKINQILVERQNIARANAEELIEQQNIYLANGSRGDVERAKALEPKIQAMREIWKDPFLGKHREGELRQLGAYLDANSSTVYRNMEGIQKRFPTALTSDIDENKRIFFQTGSSPKGTKVDVSQLDPTWDDVNQQVEDVVLSLGDINPYTVELRSGRRPTIKNVDTYGEDLEPDKMQAASGTSIRGTGSMEIYGGPSLSSEGIYGTERAYVGASGLSNEANIPPSASPSAYRLPAGSRAQGKQALNIVVAGGREYENYPELSQKLDRVISELNTPPGMKLNIVSGGARGADTLAEKYAQERGLGLQVFKADWEGQGLNAGMNRNRQMAEAGDILVAFPGGSGTENMIQQMTQDFGKPAYRAANMQEPTEIGRSSVSMSENVRKGLVQMPKMQGPSEPSAPTWIQLTRPQAPRPTRQPQQLNLPSDIVPSTAAAARVRTTPADTAAQQLGDYLAKLQRGRSAPLTSAAVIQPRLF